MNAEIKPKKRGVPAGLYTKTEPLFPEKVLTVVRMRSQGKSYNEIAKVVGGTKMNVYYTYKKWSEWGLRILGPASRRARPKAAGEGRGPASQGSKGNPSPKA